LDNKAKIDLNFVLDQLNINEHFGKEFKNYFSKFMSCGPDYFDELKISLKYDTADIKDEFLEIKIHKIEIEIPSIKNREKIDIPPSINIIKEKNSNELILSIISHDLIDKKLDKLTYFKEQIYNFIGIVFSFITKQFFYEKLVIFPAERTALTYISDDLVYRKFEKSSNVRIQKDLSDYEESDYEEPLYPKPILDYIKLIRQIKNVSSKGIVDKKFVKLDTFLEKDILSGKVSIMKDEIGSRFIYEFGNKKLDLPITSSLVKDLAIFNLYLRYFAGEGDLVIIDEPEMNLHPEAQAKLIELICILVNKGIKFIITTHTPYIVDHLINLINAHGSGNKRIEKEFFLKSKEAFLSPDDLGVYLFNKDGEVADILDREENTIDWETFGKVTQKVSDIYYKL